MQTSHILAPDDHQNKCTFLKNSKKLEFHLRNSVRHFSRVSSNLSTSSIAASKIDPSLTPERPNTGAVKIIQLTNQGEFVDRCQFTDALYELVWDRPSCNDQRPKTKEFRNRGECDDRGPKVKENAVEQPKLIVLFVHGWTHSAKDHDPNFVDFKKMIAALANDGSKQIVGIYVTWNASTGNAMLDRASFWSRQRIADRITQSGVVTRIVSMISTNRGHRDHFIAIGHSFGARMLFAAVNSPLILAAANAFPKAKPHVYNKIDAVADAVVLLNPAFEASRYTTINGLMRNEETFSPAQRPLLITISTDNDWSNSGISSRLVSILTFHSTCAQEPRWETIPITIPTRSCLLRRKSVPPPI